MAARYTDSDIQQLLAERKLLPDEYRKKLKLREKRGHREAELSVAGAAGVEFRLIARQNSLNILDFSIILAVCPAGSNQLFRLRRHNGKSHEHTNQIEEHVLRFPYSHGHGTVSGTWNARGCLRRSD